MACLLRASATSPALFAEAADLLSIRIRSPRDTVATNPTRRLLLRASRTTRDRVAPPTEASTLITALPPQDQALSSHIGAGCAIENPVHGLDLAALCLKANAERRVSARGG